MRPTCGLTVKEEQQGIHFDRIQNTVIISHRKSQTCPTVGLRGEEPVLLLLALERPMFHEECIELGTNRVCSRVALNVEDGRRWLVARNVGHNLTGPYETHGEYVSQSRCEGLDKR